MRTFSSRLNRYQVRSGPLWSDDSLGMAGLFLVPYPMAERSPEGFPLFLYILSSDGSEWDLPGLDWEHVSVSVKMAPFEGGVVEANTLPTWSDLDFVKDLFWRPEETVIQLHVPKSEHVNCHPHCLHLWRPLGVDLPRPPACVVGPASEVQEC